MNQAPLRNIIVRLLRALIDSCASAACRPPVRAASFNSVLQEAAHLKASAAAFLGLYIQYIIDGIEPRWE